MATTLFSLICQGCNRKSRAAYSVSGAINKAIQDGWAMSDQSGRPSTEAWCRRCSSTIVASAGPQ